MVFEDLHELEVIGNVAVEVDPVHGAHRMPDYLPSRGN
jgi:hypothetical protein